MQTIIAYIIVGMAVGYTIYSIVRTFSLVDTDADTDAGSGFTCDDSCSGCPMKNIKNCSKSYYKYKV